MKITLTVIMLAFISLAHAQHHETRKIGNISGISVASGIQTKFIKSSKNEVVVDVSRQDLLNKIETVVKGGNLQIRVKRGSNIRGNNSLKVTVYSNSSIESIAVSSAGTLEILDPISVNNFSADMSSAGKLKTGKVEATSSEINLSSAGKMSGELKTEKLAINASSSGELTLSGMAKQTTVNMSSNGKAFLQSFKTSNLTVNGSSGAGLKINVSNELTANVSSGAKVEYSGNPKSKSVNHSSGGSVSQL